MLRMDRCPIHTLPFPFLNRKGFPQPGRIRPFEGHSLLPEHQDFEQREREERARESEWIPPSVQAEPQIRLTVKPESPEGPIGAKPGNFCREGAAIQSRHRQARNANVVRFRSRLPFNNGLLHAPRLASGQTNKVCQHEKES